MPANLHGMRVITATALAFLLGLEGLNSPLFAQAPPVTAALDQYLAGQHEAAVMSLAALDDARKLRKAFMDDASAWISAQPSDTLRRRLVAASLALEVTHAMLDRHWRVFRELLDWAGEELRKQPRHEAEPAWSLGAVALGARTRDLEWLEDSGVLSRARRSHAQDPELRMTLTVARHYRSSFGLFFTPPIPHLTQLSEDRATAPFAQIHLARLAVHHGENDAALTYARSAANATSDVGIRYVARMIAGQVGKAVGRQDLAEAEYLAALEILPGGQSAATALAGVLIAAGRHAEAMDVMERALAKDAASGDPWRLLPYGVYSRWPTLIEQLRKATR